MGEIELRDLYDGHIYHVCTNGTDCPVLMRCLEDYHVAINYSAVSAWRTSVQIAAYSIMSNHFHFLILCEARQQAQCFIKRFKQLISTYLLKKYAFKSSTAIFSIWFLPTFNTFKFSKFKTFKPSKLVIV